MSVGTCEMLKTEAVDCRRISLGARCEVSQAKSVLRTVDSEALTRSIALAVKSTVWVRRFETAPISPRTVLRRLMARSSLASEARVAS